MESLIAKRSKYVRHMINVMRCINNEENYVYSTWLALGPPDGCTDTELLEFVEDDEWYNDVCCLFATLISEMIDTGTWTADGLSYEFYNPNKDRRLS